MNGIQRSLNFKILIIKIAMYNWNWNLNFTGKLMNKKLLFQQDNS